MGRSGAVQSLKRAGMVFVPALLLVLLAWLAVLALVRQERDDALRDASRQNANLALAFEEHTIRTLRAAQQTLDTFLVTREVALAEFMTLIALVSERGDVIAGSREIQRANLADRDYFRHHQGQSDAAMHVAAPVKGRLTGEWIIPLSRRVERPGGGFGGVVLAGVRPSYFANFYGRMNLGADGMVLLIGVDGLVRARRIGGRDTLGDDMRESTLLRLATRNPSGTFVSMGRADGTRRVTSYRTLPQLGLVVAVGTSEAEVLAPFHERRRYYVLAGSAFSLLVLAFATAIVALNERRRRARDDAWRAEARFRAAFDQAAVGMVHVALDGKFVKVNERFCRMFGYAERELVGRGFTELKFIEEAAAADAVRQSVLERGGSDVTESRYRRKDGAEIWASVAVSLVKDPGGRPDYFVAAVEDVTDRKRAQEKVLHQAQYDLLTDLPNRALFHDRLSQALHQARRQRWTAGVMYVDLDRFKQVNDTLGHAAGDALLREVASRLARAVRAGDTVARLGGDEFAVVLAQLARAEDAGTVADKIIAALGEPIAFEGRTLTASASIGIALFPRDGGDLEGLLRAADAAMFSAKQAGRRQYRYHTAPDER